MTKVEPDGDIEQLLVFLRDERGFDFTGYKRASLTRRIERRMHAVHVAAVPDYTRFLERNPDEFARLFDTILINVTSFFRDQQAWDYIASHVVPAIVASRPAEQIRIWSTGCSSGEEAYTVAMLFAEAVGQNVFNRRVKIYATDVDDDALDVGRRATYNAAQVEPVPEELRSRYFDETDGTFVVRPQLRRSVIFGRHDLVRDPPISRIDLIVSRNTLMYFDSDAQRRILATFHFALRDDGFLFLGKSEVLAGRAPTFAPVDLKRRVFAKIAADREPNLFRVRGANTPLDVSPGSAVREAGFESSPLAQLVIDDEDRLVAANEQARHLFGLTARDLGAVLQDLEVSYRPIDLRSRIDEARAESRTVALLGTEWSIGGELRFADVHVTPLTAPNGDPLGVGISFSDVTRSRRLEQALQATKRAAEAASERAEATVEEIETTNEELQSTNEELETTNEELQSANEELETINEELQSTNEELETINDELQARTDELNETNAVLETVLERLGAAAVVLDLELRVQGWNSAARELLGLRRDDARGHHLVDLDIGLPVDRLLKPIREATEGKGDGGVEFETMDRRGQRRQFIVHVAPFTVDSGEPRGTILMFEAAEQASGPAASSVPGTEGAG